MTGFKLYSLLLDIKSISTERIDLIDDFIDSNKNYFTLIVGNNGTGKSRILSEIARYFISANKGESTLFNKNSFNFNIKPSKVIAITNSISDKFPTDSSFRINNKQKILYRNFYYNYLGTRNRVNTFSNRALMNRALEIVFESYSELEVSKNYRHIFDYLEYEPIIKISYRLKHSFFSNRNKISETSLKEYLEYFLHSTSLYSDKELIDLVDNRMMDILDFIHTRLLDDSRLYELMINFSQKNIYRIRNDSSLYDDIVHDYEILNILRKIGLVQTYQIHVFKKDGTQFNFSDASSGEASILSTLLSLIPLLRDNSLVLIDEPEISLHPMWQSQYVDLLNKILENVIGCHVIIASHSPFLASNLHPNNSSVISLKNKRGIITSTSVVGSTYGWSANDILINVFGLKSTRNLDLYENVSKALILLADDKRSNEEFIRIKNNIIQFYPHLLDSDPIKLVIKAILEANPNE